MVLDAIRAVPFQTGEKSDVQRRQGLSNILNEQPLVARVQGIVINGCIRDSADIAAMPLGVKALATYPLKSSKRDPGLQNVPVSFGGVIFRPGDWLYAGEPPPPPRARARCLEQYLALAASASAQTRTVSIVPRRCVTREQLSETSQRIQ